MDELEDRPVGRKSRLYRSFVERKHGPLTFSRAALAGIVQGLRPAFLDHQSTSLMVIGSNSDALAMIVQAQHILLRESRSEWLLSGGRDRALIGRITGNLNDSDAAGIVSLADQFCLRPGRDRNLNATLEDLGVFLQQCRADGTPALVLVEDFHLFAHQKRQTLIYTLLDLLHRPDYLFAVSSLRHRPRRSPRRSPSPGAGRRHHRAPRRLSRPREARVLAHVLAERRRALPQRRGSLR